MIGANRLPQETFGIVRVDKGIVYLFDKWVLGEIKDMLMEGTGDSVVEVHYKVTNGKDLVYAGSILEFVKDADTFARLIMLNEDIRNAMADKLRNLGLEGKWHVTGAYYSVGVVSVYFVRDLNVPNMFARVKFDIISDGVELSRAQIVAKPKSVEILKDIADTIETLGVIK